MRAVMVSKLIPDWVEWLMGCLLGAKIEPIKLIGGIGVLIQQIAEIPRVSKGVIKRVDRLKVGKRTSSTCGSNCNGRY